MFYALNLKNDIFSFSIYKDKTPTMLASETVEAVQTTKMEAKVESASAAPGKFNARIHIAKLVQFASIMFSTHD